MLAVLFAAPGFALAFTFEQWLEQYINWIAATIIVVFLAFATMFAVFAWSDSYED